MALCSQIVDLIRPDLIYQTDQPGRIRQIPIMKFNNVFFNQMINTGSIGNRSTADNAVNLVTLLQ